MSETVVPFVLSVFVLVNTAGLAHVASSGPKTLKVTVPVGLAPATLTESRIGEPNDVSGTAVVEMVGVAMMTFTASFGSPHAPVAAALLTSPEYDAIQR
jgi:hypothetical protein